MPKPRTHKCKYTHCKHESRDIPPGEEVQSVPGSYWHKDCLAESQAVRDVIDIFAKKVNPDVVFRNLKATVNNIVYEKGYDAEYLRFGLQYYVDNKIPLNYPGGLYYVLQNRDVKKAWDTLNVKNQIKNTPNAFVAEDKRGDENYNYSDNNKSKFSSILKGVS